MIRPLLFLAFALLISACASASAPEPAPLPSGGAYVVLPGNYIIDLEAGSEVVLNPEAGEFVLFKSPREAAESIRREVSATRLEEGDWRVYKLKDDFAVLGHPCGRDRYCLARESIVEDWIN